MPVKSVREMSPWERLKNSASTKTFYTVLAVCIVISLFAILLGVFLYRDTVMRNFRIATWEVARSASSLVDRDKVIQKGKKVIEIYDSMSEEERSDPDNRDYLKKYNSIVDDDYEEMRKTLFLLQENNDVMYVYLTIISLNDDRQLMLVDPDRTTTWKAPGHWIESFPDEADAYLKGKDPSLLDRFFGEKRKLPTYVSKTDDYGYLCTGSDTILRYKDYAIVATADSDMNSVVKASLLFLLYFILVMLAIALACGFILSRLIQRAIVDPVNQLSDAAMKYVDDKNAGRRAGRHFEELDIHTGDEIENLSLVLKDMEYEMGEYYRDLRRMTAKNERINTELDVAGQIQDGMVPHIFPPFPEHTEFDLYASMKTAREVGGDFYDYFFIDKDHLVIVMADVSGKGVPAALFMMASKILLNNVSVISERDPAKILETVNNRICSNNPIEMFVTVWLGILEISTGKLQAANAGHEYPAIRKCGEEFQMFRDKHGFVLGGLPGMKYTNYEIQMDPGDMLYVYTDGVTEAANENNELFGTDRMLNALNAEAKDTPEEILDAVSAHIQGFVGKVPASDDITMLCLRYNGAGDDNNDTDNEEQSEI